MENFTGIKREYHSNGKLWYKEYYENGKLHRIGGPTVIEYDFNEAIKLKSYCKKGDIYNNIKGPSYIAPFYTFCVGWSTTTNIIDVISPNNF